MGRSKRRRSRHRHYGNVELLSREQVYPVDLIETFPEGESHFLLEGRRVEINNLRIQTLRKKGLVCAGCAIKADFAALELVRSPSYNGWAINFYAVRDDGTEVIFTKDHVRPLSKGGQDDLANLQPMCWPCNLRKGSRTDWSPSTR